jgi:RNA polymerase sigma-70 factor (ECF subfamily)
MLSPQLDDARLVARCRDGDAEAWSLLVRRYSAYVHAIAVRSYRLEADDAEDVFQEVFARTYDRLDDLRDDGAIRPWLGQLTRRLCVDRLRAGSRTTPVAEVTEVAADEPDLDLALTVREAMEHLPEQAREVLDRFFARDESYRTISEALGVPPGTVASRISRALASLREAMEETDGPTRPVGVTFSQRQLAAGRIAMSDEPKKDEEQDVEGHKFGNPVERANEPSERSHLNEDDEPDVEGHKYGNPVERATDPSKRY